MGRRKRFAVLAAAALTLYAVAGWLLLLPPVRLPPSIPLAGLPAAACGDSVFIDHVRQQRAILFVPLAEVPPDAIEALRRSEDPFYHHRGVDWDQMVRAFVKDIAAGEYRYGASTLTMQLMRELLLGKERTLLRKTREIAYALQAERRLSKSEILELYVNVVDWGAGARGIGAASCYYFGRPPARLDAEESSRLVAILPSPDRLGPPLRAWAQSREGRGAVVDVGSGDRP